MMNSNEAIKRRRVLFYWDGTSWGAHLPNYAMVPDSILPVIAGMVGSNGVARNVDPNNPALPDLTCEVETLADEWDDERGEPNEKVLLERYPEDVARKHVERHRAEKSRRRKYSGGL